MDMALTPWIASSTSATTVQPEPQVVPTTSSSFPPISGAVPTEFAVSTTTQTISLLTTVSVLPVSSRLPTTTSAMKPATVTSVGGALSEQCRVAAITVMLAKDFLLDYNIQENSLYLGLMGCRINGGNSTHVQLTVAWNECAIQLIHVRPSFPSQAQLLQIHAAQALRRTYSF